VYDKPLFAGSSANQIYRPRFQQSEGDMYGNEDRAQQAEPSTAKFKPDRDFSGVDRFVCLLQSSFLILSALCVYYILRCLIFRLLTSKQVEEKCCAQRARRVREER
jgi:hypothetical protein